MMVAGNTPTTAAAAVVTSGPVAATGSGEGLATAAGPTTTTTTATAVNPGSAAAKDPGARCPTPTAFTSLAGAQVWLTTGVFTVPAGPTQTERHFLAPDFVAAWSWETPVDPFFGPIFKGAAATVGGPVDCHGRPVTGATSRPAGGTFIIRCGMLYRRGQGEADRLCVPDGGGLWARILQECHDTPLGGTEYEAAAPRRPKALRARHLAGGSSLAAAAPPVAAPSPSVAPTPPMPSPGCSGDPAWWSRFWAR